ncbi:molybdenum ABC transporter ATP-binding protein [Solilutibacter silvestris]|uniref:Molybdate ABC transporter, ATP-binding protein n=1 Tax=Solilutibacter silvestris TaxID=1645665 RepID=A0A2K1Q3E9_9GAMM|nr:molybdenum ABC transporter ATP-binding protein [Lysobacter silvestris]PNS09487.1 molybdate ABC transporter, ATP-binding protein [Lysobacter silvestris]
MSAANDGLRAALSIRRGALSLDLDIALPAHGVTVLFGASGSGKTSCLRAIAGLEHSPGTVTFKDACWQDDARGLFVPTYQRRVGYVFQESSLFDHLTVAGNLDYGFRRAGRPSSIDAARWIDDFGVRPLLARRVAALSGGERQRVAIVRALMANPRLLLLDEPLSALDGSAKTRLLAELERLRTTLPIPLIYVSHSVEEVARLADHLVLLDGGRVVAQGPLQQTLARIDLPCALIETLGSVVEGKVSALHRNDNLMELAFAGGTLCLPHAEETVGQTLRCRIDARDVVIARDRATASSALNQIHCEVVAVIAADHPAQCLVQLDAHGTRLLARITWHSWHALGLAPGDAVWAQVKAVALGS